MAKAQGPKDIDDYIATFPAEVQTVLEKVRQTIRDAAPDAKIRSSAPELTTGCDATILSGVRSANRNSSPARAPPARLAKGR
jgi:uncharacterized protein YdhG (YjbR/CyaY superfamily)